MPSLHFLNVGEGDCIILRRDASDHTTVIDLCGGNISLIQKFAALQEEAKAARPRGDFGMRFHPTNPIEYLKANNMCSAWRFVSTHPDMDHLDGFASFLSQISLGNFWDNGIRRPKPVFGDKCPYKEEDWDAYVKVRDGKVPGITVVTPRAGDKMKYANTDDANGNGDYLDIVAPNQALIDEANKGGDHNDASYVLVYRSSGGNVVIPGDAHDSTWKYILDNHRASVANCAILLAPHHGRHSDRDYAFLDSLKPKLTLFGVAKSDYLGYSAWSNRKLPILTNNQAGNIVLEFGQKLIDVYIENRKYAEQAGGNLTKTNTQGYFYLMTVK